MADDGNGKRKAESGNKKEHSQENAANAANASDIDIDTDTDIDIETETETVTDNDNDTGSAPQGFVVVVVNEADASLFRCSRAGTAKNR